MIALLLALTLQAAPAEEDIVVLGQRLIGVEVFVGKDAKGKFTCDLNRSTGNAQLDAALCKTASTCVRKGAVSQTDVRMCINRRTPELLEDVRRALGRKGG